jgi:hypothetical protein
VDCATELLESAIGALPAAPLLPVGLPTEVHLAGGPQDQLDDARATVIRRRILDLVLALNATLPAAVRGQPGRGVLPGTAVSSSPGAAP